MTISPLPPPTISGSLRDSCCLLHIKVLRRTPARSDTPADLPAVVVRPVIGDHQPDLTPADMATYQRRCRRPSKNPTGRTQGVRLHFVGHAYPFDRRNRSRQDYVIARIAATKQSQSRAGEIASLRMPNDIASAQPPQNSGAHDARGAAGIRWRIRASLFSGQRQGGDRRLFQHPGRGKGKRGHSTFSLDGRLRGERLVEKVECPALSRSLGGGRISRLWVMTLKSSSFDLHRAVRARRAEPRLRLSIELTVSTCQR